MKREMKSGQILILVLLIVVVTLAVGLSVASRNLTNLRSSTQTEQSQRAFTAAEGGIEDILSRFSTVKNDAGVLTGGQNYSVPVGDLTSTVNLKGLTSYEQILDTGDVGQIDLAGPPAYNGPVYIEWGKNAGSGVEASPYASLAITFVCSTAAANCIDAANTVGFSGYKQRRYAYYIGSAHPGELGFSSCTTPGVGYACKLTLNTNGSNVLFVRIRPLWKATTVKVTGSTGPPAFPPQTYEIESSATTNVGVSRRVKVVRNALPTLPAAFDFAIYSENAISK